MTFMPMSATLALFGILSMSGFPLPFLNGFYSKELFFDSANALNAYTGGFLGFLQEALPYLAVFGSIFTFVYSMYFFFGTFRGQAKLEELPKKPHEAPIGMLISPIILVLGVLVIGLFPNVFVNGLLGHTATAVSGEFYEPHEIYFWHGWDYKPFLMTLVVIALGVLLTVTRKKWSSIYNVFPRHLSFNTVYDFIMDKTERVSSRITKTYMTGSLRHYMSYILVAIIAITSIVLVVTNGFDINTSYLATITIPEVLVAIMMAVAAIATIFTNSRLAAIIILGVVGYGLSILFVIYQAPDLALTQLIIETVTVALFLLCFYHLPELRKRDDTLAVKSSNTIISVGFGVLITLIAISSHSNKLFEPISSYFVETSKSLGGGANIVNVILVDMRGLDTLFEITVLGIAALAIYGMLKIRRDKEAK